MTIRQFILKVRRKLWYYLVSSTRNKRIYPYIYKSYWHYLLHGTTTANSDNCCYFGARPNPGAGIGHQIANWIAGFWFAKQFGLKFAHIPFSQHSWETFLGFGDEEMTSVDLVKLKGYKKRLLPLFDEYNNKEIDLVKNILSSYYGKKIVFIAEQDQFYRDQFGVMTEIRDKFYSTKARIDDKLLYSSDYFNISIHVRRGDIVAGQINRNENLLMRWQTNEYFETVLSNVIQTIKPAKPIAIYLFSQGVKEDFKYFEKFENLNFCLDMGAKDSFLHMVYADLLITSKSSFSYKPALLNRGIKVCPKDFWHGYPQTADWILVDQNGILDEKGVNTLREIK